VDPDLLFHKVPKKFKRNYTRAKALEEIVLLNMSNRLHERFKTRHKSINVKKKVEKRLRKPMPLATNPISCYNFGAP
jgi:hypothetical protein